MHLLQCIALSKIGLLNVLQELNLIIRTSNELLLVHFALEYQIAISL